LSLEGDLYAITDEIEFRKAQIARLTTRAYVSRVALMDRRRRVDAGAMIPAPSITEK
jgi:hypothetical protein